MANIRNITSDVQFLAELGREVQPDELVEVDDDYFRSRLFPESIWRVTSAPKQKKASLAEGAAEPNTVKEQS